MAISCLKSVLFRMLWIRYWTYFQLQCPKKLTIAAIRIGSQIVARTNRGFTSLTLLEENMYTLPWLWLNVGVIALAFLPVNLEGERGVDELHAMSGHFSYYRIDDSTRFLYGTFTITSNSGLTQISAHRLKVGTGPTQANSFVNDLMTGKVFSDGVDVHVNYLLLKDVFRVSAEKVAYSRDSLTIQLRGHAVVQGDDLKIAAPSITIMVSKWNSSGR